MVKRKPSFRPWPREIWHTEGHSVGSDLPVEVAEHLAALQRTGAISAYQQSEAHHPVLVGELCSVFDATWRGEGGAVVRARLWLKPYDDTVAVRGGQEFGWTLSVRCDRAWNNEWPSPLLKFFPDQAALQWDKDACTGSMVLRHATGFRSRAMKDLPEVLSRMASGTPWYIMVITHDRRNTGVAVESPAPCLVDLLPRSLVGRVVELRVSGDQDALVNEALEAHRVYLPMGGMVIVPTTLRSATVSASAFSMKPPPGRDVELMLKAAAERVAAYAEFPAHMDDRVRRFTEILDQTWILPLADETPGPDPVAEQYAQEVGALKEQLSVLERRLAGEAEARRDAEQAREEASAAVERMRQEEAANPLAERADTAEQFMEEALKDSEVAQHLLDDALSEISWLRRERAQVPGQSYDDPAPQQTQGPASWQQLGELVSALMPHIRLNEGWDQMGRQRGHKHEDQWIRRTWECLEALEAYAGAKAQHGAHVLPHFSSYLTWPEATERISVNLYCASEANLQNIPKFASQRTFTVPGLGPVFMQEHFRVGGVRPPAPRMHVYDDTAGPTGLVHVGYVGPHLPNFKNV
jgi:hypothetical protein